MLDILEYKISIIPSEPSAKLPPVISPNDKEACVPANIDRQPAPWDSI